MTMVIDKRFIVDYENDTTVVYTLNENIIEKTIEFTVDFDMPVNIVTFKLPSAELVYG